MILDLGHMREMPWNILGCGCVVGLELGRGLSQAGHTAGRALGSSAVSEAVI